MNILDQENKAGQAGSTSAPPRRRILEEPSFGWGESSPYKPTFREVCVEWIDAINFIKTPSRFLTAMFTAFHLATFVVFVYFLFHHASPLNLAVIGGIAFTISTIYNTVWYHRYCTHRAYRFRHLAWTRLFLWTNPVCFREESYVIPHRVHHAKEDKVGDPYGPHLGRFGSYMASESSAKTNRAISPSEYRRLAEGLKHIGIPLNSYEQFQRTGSVEKAWHWMARSLFANLLWCSLSVLVFGGAGISIWLAGVFLYTFIVRDFNYRGHGGFFVKASRGHATNNPFYGVVSGEWHENHHANPCLAHSGMKWWQLDLPYHCIRAMSLLGIVEQMNTLKGRAPHQRADSTI